MIVIAHRGASAYAPENTEASFDLGIALGADALETDIRATRDGVLVLLHDARVDRTTNGQGLVADLTWDDVQRLDAGSWKSAEYTGQRIPRFEWLLDRFAASVPLYLEIKAPGVEETVVDAVQRRGLLDQVIFTSFNLDSLKAATALAPVRAGWLVREWTDEVATQAREVPLYEMSLGSPSVTPEIVQEVRRAGLGCRAWGIANDSLMERAIAAGVDGMTIDFPDVLLRRLGRVTNPPG